MKQQAGLRIKKLRKDNKDTLKSLANKINYDWSNLSKVERGSYSASFDMMKKIAEVYNINPAYFFGDGFTEWEENLKSSDTLVEDEFEVTEEEIKLAIQLIRMVRSNNQK